VKILLTGATGGLGRNAARHLREAGHRVVCTGRDRRILSNLAVEGFEAQAADLASDRLESVLEGCEAVVHAAARSSVWGPDPEFVRDNVLATRRLLEASVSVGVRRFVHVSSPSILHVPRDRTGLREDMPLPPPPNAYARTKAQAESVVRSFSDRIETIGIRPRGLYGPWDGNLFPRLARANAARGIPLVRGGRFLVDLTGMPNACDALESCLRAPDSALGTFYHASDGVPLPFRQAVEDVFGAMGIPVRWKPVPGWLLSMVALLAEGKARLTGGSEPVVTRYGASLLSHAQTLDLAAARGRLGWTPRHRWTENVAAYAAWWRAHP
jgi:nucleoside-diphosphate-sugar epimerase